MPFRKEIVVIQAPVLRRLRDPFQESNNLYPFISTGANAKIFDERDPKAVSISRNIRRVKLIVNVILVFSLPQSREAFKSFAHGFLVQSRCNL
jgi:hypothetical protein